MFVGLPLGVGNVDLTNNTKQRCVYVACAYMQSAEDAVNSGALLPDDTWEPVDDSNSSDDELNPISYEDKVINEVYGTVWDGWETMIRIILNGMRSPMAWSWIICLRIPHIISGVMMQQRTL